LEEEGDARYEGTCDLRAGFPRARAAVTRTGRTPTPAVDLPAAAISRMRRPFSLADLFPRIAPLGVLLAFQRGLGPDGVIQAAPFGGVIVGRRFPGTIPESAGLRRSGGTGAASVPAIAACLADPRPHVRTAADDAFGFPICVLSASRRRQPWKDCGSGVLGGAVARAGRGPGARIGWPAFPTGELLAAGVAPGGFRFPVPLLTPVWSTNARPFSCPSPGCVGRCGGGASVAFGERSRPDRGARPGLRLEG
jgi:hypothetical protein